MKRIILGTLLLFFIALISIHCSDSPSSGMDEDIPDNDPDPEVNQACENITLSSNSAQPTDIVSVQGFTADFGEEAVAWVQDPDNPEVEVPIVFFADFSKEQADFAVPLHPTNQMDGGEVAIEIVQENEEFSCPNITFTIEALTPSPRATEEFIESYGNGLKEVLGEFGYDSDELPGLRTEDVEPVAIPFLMAHHALESNLFENDLTSIINGTAPLLDGEPLTTEQKEVLDALLAGSNIGQYLNEYLSSISSILNDLPRAEDSLQKSASVSGNEVVLEPPDYISKLMKSQREAEDLVTGFKGAALQAGALTTGLVSVIAGLATVGTAGAGSPATVPIGAAAGYATTVISTTLFVTEALSDLLPSKLVSFELFATESSFNEDSEKTAKWENFMTVESRNFELSASDVIGFIGTGKVLDNKFVKDKIGEVNQIIFETFAEMNLAIVGGYDESGFVAYEKNTWTTDVDIDRANERNYFEWEFNFLDSWDGSPPVLAFCSSCVENTNGFYPLKAGESELRVEAIAEQFGFPTNPVSNQRISVDPIQIEVNPESTTLLLEEVKNGEAVDLTATVENAVDPTLSWSADEGYFEIHDDVANHVTYYPPEKLGDFTVTAESITETGPREGLEPTRSDYARVYVRDEEKSCFNGDLSDDDVYEFTVEASGSYEKLENDLEFSITYNFLEPRENEEGCLEYGYVSSDDISLPWSTSQIITAPGGATINMVGQTDHTNNITLRILVDGEEVASYTHQGILDEEAVVPESENGAGLSFIVE